MGPDMSDDKLPTPELQNFEMGTQDDLLAAVEAMAARWESLARTETNSRRAESAKRFARGCWETARQIRASASAER
jgi:hypothetical protein